MAVSWTEILKALPTIVAGMLPGLSATTRVGKAARSVTLPMQLKGASFDYPSLSRAFDYPMVRGGSETSVNGVKTKLPALNFGINRENAEAALVQDLAKHNQAVANGTEKTLEEWWPTQDSKPRREIHPESSAIEGIRIAPDGTVQVKWIKGNKWYTYKAGNTLRESSEWAKDLLTAPSIGRALVRNGHLAHKDSKDLTGKPVADANVGWWGRKHYNPNW